MVTLKGTKEGLLISLGEGEWREVMDDLTTQLDRPRAADFFRGARIRLDMSDRVVTFLQFQELAELLERFGMKPEWPQEARTASTPEPSVAAEPAPSSNGRERTGSRAAMMVRRTVRSGQVIRHEGDVVVYGDVNPGAEIIADGDVLVWGKLRGVVHAGATGNEQAVVGALLLAPTQLRVGSLISRAPDKPKKKAPGAEMARVRDGRIVIESWTV
jgi:septum site-determining protein MinC